MERHRKSLDDVIDGMNERFMKITGKNLPEGWNTKRDGETNTDEQT